MPTSEPTSQSSTLQSYVDRYIDALNIVEAATRAKDDARRALDDAALAAYRSGIERDDMPPKAQVGLDSAILREFRR